MEQFNLSNLPKYWVVKLDEKSKLHPFSQDFLKILNSFQLETEKPWMGSCTNNYYGYDGNADHGGTNSWTELKYFKNNPVLLTMDEFQQLVTRTTAINDYSIF